MATAAAEHHGFMAPRLDTVGLLRTQVQEVHHELDECLMGWLRSLAPASPPAASQAVGLYVHAATVEDVTIHSLLLGVDPVYQTDWGGKGPAHYVTTDLAPIRAYAQQVFAATDAYLAGLAPEALEHKVDLTRHGLGKPTIAWVVSKFVVLQLARICGELTSTVLDPQQPLSSSLFQPER